LPKISRNVPLVSKPTQEPRAENNSGFLSFGRRLLKQTYTPDLICPVLSWKWRTRRIDPLLETLMGSIVPDWAVMQNSVKRALRDRSQEGRRALRSVRIDLLIRERDTVHSIPG
jgi:hypothetical protein